MTEAKDFAASLYAAAAAVLAECDRPGWSDPDVAALRDALAASSNARAG
jgi:hypothetical protein